jgi:hypothetical protein
MSVKNASDAIGNLTRNLPVCSAVLQPTAPLRAPTLTETRHKVLDITTIQEAPFIVNMQEQTTLRPRHN